MNFLPPSYIPCQECDGKRYNGATLEIEYNGKSIGDIMEMTVEEAADFFGAHPKIRRALRLMVETGLGYLKLGQPSPTLSGGEAQRIKLVSQLARRATAAAEEVQTSRRGKSTLYILEEPTIGLHAHDVAQLINILHRLVDEGGTVVVVEHHMDVIAEADHIVDLGPEAGANGGEIVAAGSPEEVALPTQPHGAIPARNSEKKSALPIRQNCRLIARKQPRLRRFTSSWNSLNTGRATAARLGTPHFSRASPCTR